MDIPERTLLEIFITSTRRRMLRPLIPSHLHVLDVLNNYNAGTHTRPGLCTLEYRFWWSGGRAGPWNHLQTGGAAPVRPVAVNQVKCVGGVKRDAPPTASATLAGPHVLHNTHMAIPPLHIPSTRLWYSLNGANHHPPCTKALAKKTHKHGILLTQNDKLIYVYL